MRSARGGGIFRRNWLPRPRFRNSFKAVVIFLTIALSLAYDIFGTTDIVMAISCDSNESTQAACEEFEGGDENVGALWISKSSSGTSAYLEYDTLPESGIVTAYVLGAFIYYKGQPTAMSTENIHLTYCTSAQCDRVSNGTFPGVTEVSWISGAGGTVDRGSVAEDAESGTWSTGWGGNGAEISIDTNRLMSDSHTSSSGNEYTATVGIWRCPAGGSVCWSDPVTITIRLPFHYRRTTYVYERIETIENADERTVTNTQYYKGTSTATAASSASKNPVPDSGTVSTSSVVSAKASAEANASNNNKTATLTIYDRVRKNASASFVENITKLSATNDTYTETKKRSSNTDCASGVIECKRSSSNTFGTRASGSILKNPEYSVSGDTEDALSGVVSGQNVGNVYSSTKTYAVSPGNTVEKSQTLTFTPSITYTGTQKRNENVLRKFTCSIVEVDKDNDERSDETLTSGTCPDGTVLETTTGDWTTTELSPEGESRVSGDRDRHHAWLGWKAPVWTSSSLATPMISVTSNAKIVHPYVYWQETTDVQGRQDASANSTGVKASDIPATTIPDPINYSNYWDKTTPLDDYYVRSNNFSISYASKLIRATDQKKPSTYPGGMAGTNGNNKESSSGAMTDYLTPLTSYNAELSKQGDVSYIQYSFENSNGVNRPEGNNGQNDANQLNRRAMRGIPTNTNYVLNDAKTGYVSGTKTYPANNHRVKTEATSVTSGDNVNITNHYSGFTATNTTNCSSSDACTGYHSSGSRFHSNSIYYRNHSGKSGIIDNNSINLRKGDIQFGPYVSLSAGNYVVYYSGTRLHDCTFDYLTDGITAHATQVNNVAINNTNTAASFSFEATSDINNGGVEFRCTSHDNGVRITSITIAKYESNRIASSAREELKLGNSLKYFRILNHDTQIVIEHGSDGTNRLLSRTTSVPGTTNPASAQPRTGTNTKSSAAIYTHFPYNYKTETDTVFNSKLTPGSQAKVTFKFKITRRTNPLVLSSSATPYRTATRENMKLQGAIFYVPANVNINDSDAIKSAIENATKASVDKATNNNGTNNLCDAINSISSYFQGCNVVKSDASEISAGTMFAGDDGKQYAGSNNDDFRNNNFHSLEHNFVVPDVSNENIGVKICAVSGINYADSHYLPDGTLNRGASGHERDYAANHNHSNIDTKKKFGSNDYSVDSWRGTPTNNPHWRISGVVCKNLTVKPTFQVWNGNFFANGSVATSTTVKYPPGKNIAGGLPARYNDAIAGARYYGSWAEYAFLAGGTTGSTSTGFASGSRLGYPSGTLGSDGGGDYCKNSPMSIANYMDGLACISGDAPDEVGKSGIEANPSKFLEQIKARFVDRLISENRLTLSNDKTDERDMSLHYRKPSSGSVNLSALAPIKIKAFKGSETPAITDDDHDVYVYIVDGTLTIDRNICTASTTCNNDLILINRNNTEIRSYNQIPQVIIIARNINITSKVDQIDAWLIATGGEIITKGDGNKYSTTLNANGKINTCSVDVDSGTTINNPNKLTSELCNHTLLFNGPVLAKEITLNRTNVQNGLANSSVKVPTANLNQDFKSATAAEIFNLRPDTYLWAYRQATKYEYASTVYVKELAPRL